MASLIGPLASGIAGAASGTAEIYARGTSTASSKVYSDVDGRTAVTTHSLDANGGVTRYVTEPVDVVVKNSSGSAVRTFSWDDDARSVQVRNAGYNGTDPATLATVAGGRTYLDTILTNLYTSLGGKDGKVLVNGAEQNVKDVLAGTTAVLFNVKSSAYGAKGDDSNDDTSALQAAINAASDAGGGIVYVPPGTYKVTAALNISSAKVCVLGVTPDASVIKRYGNITGLNITAANVTVMNLGFGRDGTGVTGKPIATSGADTVLFNCEFAGANDYHISVGASATAVATACVFFVTEASGGIATGAAGGLLSLVGCRASIGQAVTCIATIEASMVGGSLDGTAAAGTVTVFGSGGRAVGVNVTASSGTCTVELGASVRESCCSLGSNVFVWGTTGPASGYSQSVNHGRTSQTGTGTSYSVSLRYRFHEVNQTGGASMAFTNPGGGAVGMQLVFIYRNTSGGAITPTFGTQYAIGTAPSVGNNQTAVFVFAYSATASEWQQVGGNAVAYNH
jgi:hypothetical protein